MKTTTASTLSFAVLAAGLFSVGLAGCNKSDRSDVSATAKDMVSDSKDAMSHGWDNVKTFTFDKRDDFSANAKAIGSKWDAQMSELHANYSEAKASASRKAAMAELKDSDAAYKEKLKALGSATADTWDSAKQNVIASWDKLQANYDKAKAD